MDDYDGLHIIDRDGSSVGTVERSFADDNDVIRMIEVKIGTLFAKHRLVPVDNVETANSGLVVPYSKQTIEDSPEIAGGAETLEGDTLHSVRQYYRHVSSSPGLQQEDTGTERGDIGPVGAVSATSVASDDRRISETAANPSTTTAAVQPPEGDAGLGGSQDTAGGIRDTGEYIEVPIIEERLVKQAVVKEVLRIRKRDVAQQQIVSEDVRREHVEVDPDVDVPVRDNS